MPEDFPVGCTIRVKLKHTKEFHAAVALLPKNTFFTDDELARLDKSVKRELLVVKSFNKILWVHSEHGGHYELFPPSHYEIVKLP